jgi:TIR domain
MPVGPASTGQSGQASEPAARTRGSADRFKVFVSYSRADSGFADEIEAGLEYDGGFDVLIDRHDIHEGEEWKKRLGALIAQADTVVFILSRKSAASPICQWEVEHAKELSKRIIPIQAESLGDLEAPPALAALNYVRFDEGRSFMAGLTGLRRALKTDIDWLREHTRLLTRAQEWQAADRAGNRLLSGSDIAAAKAWLDRSPAEGLQPTELHRDFIQASDQAETLRLSAERERAEKLERAVRRTRTALGVAVVFACVAGGLGLYATRQRRVAESATRAAEGAAGEAQRQEQLAKDSAKLALAESERADRFVKLVSSHPAGQRAMEKICLEAIQVTSTLATTIYGRARQQARDRFWELYYASMYIVELHQRKKSGSDVSSIEGNMVRFGEMLASLESSENPLPNESLCALAKEVRDGCVDHLQLTAPEPCR